MTGFTAQAVAQMQSDLSVAERRIRELETLIELVTHERDELRDQNATLRTERDDAMAKAVEMRTILEHTSLGLITGLKKLTDTEVRARQARRELQERKLADENGTPSFLREAITGSQGKRATPPLPSPTTPPDVGRRAPEKTAVAVPQRDVAPYETGGDDPRLPPVRITDRGPHDPDELEINLRDIARDIADQQARTNTRR